LEKFKLIDKIKALYQNGENIIQYLRDVENRNFNTIEDILISYDFQSGSYIKQFYSHRAYHEQYCQSIAAVINKLGSFNSIMEAGVGEATTLGVMIQYLTRKPPFILGFDLSWSRIHFAKSFTKDQGLADVTLFTSDLFETPLADDSIDIVYTSHSIEPNGGKEKEALTELYRIAKRYVVLLEPSFEFGSDEAKERMLKLGYVTSLGNTAKSLGYKIIEHRLFDLSSNPLNPTGLLVIEKKAGSTEPGIPHLVCPVSKTALNRYENVLFSPDSLLAYPIVKDIPCLLKQNAILAAHFNMDFNNFRSGILS
jgi:ubiquinone/menaquinone biosynthesis C-methylase UbiE/uncharacterized protein YbaR (Trm112 family)